MRDIVKNTIVYIISSTEKKFRLKWGIAVLRIFSQNYITVTLFA